MQAKKSSNFSYWFGEKAVPHIVLFTYMLIALFPIVLILINSFKERKAIFKTPLALPNAETFSLDGYATLMERSNFPLYFTNSLVVTVVSIFLILFTGAMAAYALSEYKFRGNAILGIYLALGIMIPIRLGTVGILRLMAGMKERTCPLAELPDAL
ncbi:MAG: carbohydrate ABC transporter permease [Chloroflexi bacterium]|nr:carbohydrate ABC transporter permease [Chloroflexota bacterium]